MYLVYVDESGDTGLNKSPTEYFVLSSIVVHESQWNRFLDDTIAYRRSLREHYGLKLREELHATKLFTKPGDLARIDKHLRLQICKKTIDFQENLQYISMVNVVVRKANKPPTFNVFNTAWTYLIQRIHNTVLHQNFPAGFGGQEKAIFIPDQTHNKELNQIVRKMRRYNPVPNMGFGGYRMITTDLIVEDPYYKDSSHSYFHQLVDMNAYFLFQMHQPNSYIKKKKGYNFFKRYDNALCKVASTKNEYGIVYV